MEAVSFAFLDFARSRSNLKKQRYSGQPDPKGHAIKETLILINNCLIKFCNVIITWLTAKLFLDN